MMVLVGAGQLGRKIGAALFASAHRFAFADNDPAKQDTIVDDVRVLSVPNAAAYHKHDQFCVTIWGAQSPHRIRETENRLGAYGVTNIVSFTTLLRQHRLTHYFIEDAKAVDAAHAEIAAARALWSDHASALEYGRQLSARVLGNVSLCGEPVPGPQYFPSDLFRYRADEVVLDGGAYTGDTLRDYLNTRGDQFARWIAVEPHPDNLQQLAAYLESPALLPLAARIGIRAAALGSYAGFTSMTAAGGLDARIVSAPDTIRVPIFAGDSLEPPYLPTFIKLDIEGNELAAIEGMRALIMETRPVMAVCVYHRQHHLWDIPLRLAQLMPKTRFYLRPHGAEGWDTVCYAVPEERAL